MFEVAYTKTLTTSVGTFKLRMFNVAIVGNSHASYMSDFIRLDNDLYSISVGNHSVGGDDLGSYGTAVDIYTTTGRMLIAKAGDLKGWISEFINDSPYVEYAICWFGSNSLNQPIDYFIKHYRNWILRVREKSSCKLIIMSIPYSRNHARSRKEDVDAYNAAIKEMTKEFVGVHYEDINNGPITYTDAVHLSKQYYFDIWINLKIKYGIVVKELKEIPQG